MHRSAALREAQSFLQRWLLRGEAVPVLPVVLLAGYWVGGEVVLLSAAALLPVFHLFSVSGRSADHAPSSARDQITNLPLRGAVVEALEVHFSSSTRSARTAAAFAIAIDEFAEIEARSGLHAAECVLRRVGERIAAALRGTDLVARIEHEVYAAAFAPSRRVDLEMALQVAARIQEAVRVPILVEGARLYVTCSIGFCLGSRAPRPSGEAALEAALEALREARAAGPGSVRAFMRQRPGSAARRTVLEAEVLEALENGQIRPWFQPQVATVEGQITGLEALARWEHPERGVLGPADFLPAVTAAGRMERLGEVILYHGLTAMRDWDRQGLYVPSLGVNFAADELRSPHLADRLVWELDRFGLTPERLTVEILETVVAEPGDDCVARTIAALARTGCRIDLDDFGTGHASLAALQRFQVSRIKIDRSFVINLHDDPAQQRMVAAIIGLANQLGLDTLAEDVERLGEHAMLAEMGRGHVQGFAIARPMPFEDVARWMQAHGAKLVEAKQPSRHAI